MIDFSRYECLTFDCYGTLVDWEAGMLAAIKPVLAAHHRSESDEKILELYAAIESKLEAGPYMSYRQVLERAMQMLASRLSFALHEGEIDTLANSVKNWPPFPDTIDALRRLKTRYRLAIISNIDDDLFADTAKLLEVAFDFVITAQQAGSYKPSHNNFELALRRIGLPKEKILHCAQSIFHDIVPARALGIANVWVNRRAGRAGTGATPRADATPDLTVTSLKELADRALA